MADNVAITPGTGATVAADDISGVLYQRVKIAQGADGVGVDVSAAAPLSVSLVAAKARTAIWAAQTLTAGAGATTSAWVDLSLAHGAQLSFAITNGATGPTVPAQVQIQVANDWNAGTPTLPVNYGGAIIGSVTSSAVAYFSTDIPAGVAAIRLIAGSNTAQNVTVDADISRVTAL